MTTFAPSLTKWRAIAAPWPCAPPVTMANFPLSLLMTILLDADLHDRVGREAQRRVPGLEVGAEGLVQLDQVEGVPGGVEALLEDGRGDQADHAAVHEEELAADLRRRRRGQVGDQRSDVLGGVRVDGLAAGVLAEDGRGHRG